MKRIIMLLATISLLMTLVVGSAFADNAFPRSSLLESDIPAYVDGGDYYIEINEDEPDFEIWQYTTFRLCYLANWMASGERDQHMLVLAQRPFRLICVLR